ncbi:HAD family hydrolase [Aeromonas molluscorum]|uniref:HAD family hydrolase n=1 Tax=Aeromonas molluscorum TaxID=271417 RepID=UPI003F19FE51
MTPGACPEPALPLGPIGEGLILADFDGTLAPGDSHAGLLRFILGRRRWPLMLSPLLRLGALLSLLPARWFARGRGWGIRLIWWSITLGLSPLAWRALVRAYSASRLGLFAPAMALLASYHHRLWIVSASPRALVRGQLALAFAQAPACQPWPAHIEATRLRYAWGGLIPHHYCHGAAKITPAMTRRQVALCLSDSLHDLPLLRLGTVAWLVNPKPSLLRRARARLPRIVVKQWRLPGVHTEY